jgi:hypothetical protein
VTINHWDYPDTDIFIFKGYKSTFDLDTGGNSMIPNKLIKIINLSGSELTIYIKGGDAPSVNLYGEYVSNNGTVVKVQGDLANNFFDLGNLSAIEMFGYNSKYYSSVSFNLH